MSISPEKGYLISSALSSNGLRTLGVYEIVESEKRLSLPERILTLSRDDSVDSLSSERLNTSSLAIAQLVEDDDPVLGVQIEMKDDKYEEVSLDELRQRIIDFCLNRAVIASMGPIESHDEVASFVNSILDDSEANKGEDQIKIGQYL